MSILNNMARGAGATLLAQKATSFEAFDGGTITRSMQSHTARDYFRKYGTMPHRFEYSADYNVYYGYVSAFNRPEFLSFVALKDNATIIVSYVPNNNEINGPDDLSQRQSFALQCLLEVRLKILGATTTLASQASSPPNPILPASNLENVQKNEASGAAYFCFILLFIAIALIAYVVLVN